MMDAQWTFCKSMSIAGNAGTATDATDCVDMGQHYDHNGVAKDDNPNVSGKNFFNVIVEDEALDAAVNNCALTITLHADTDTTTPTTDGDIIITKNITVTASSSHPAGTVLLRQSLPVEAMNKVLAVKFTRATQNLSTGKVTAWIGTQMTVQ
jgi:hypothetical protein